MKKYLLLRFVSWLSFSALVFEASNVHAQALLPYYPCDFETIISLGCNCSCFCPTNMDMTNTPVGAFFAQYGVTGISGTTAIASTNGGQYVPPHWALLVPTYSDNSEFEGWRTNLSSPALNPSGGYASPTPPGNFNNPIIALLGYSFYTNIGVLGDLDPKNNGADLPDVFQAPTNQPYPWDINVTLTLNNYGQTYVMEQQLAVGPLSLLPNTGWGEPLGSPPLGVIPVNYVETNSVLDISLYCIVDGTNALYINNATITATLLTNNIPPPLAIQPEGPSANIFTNWAWPLTTNDMTDTTGTIPGAAGTVQAEIQNTGPGYIQNLPLLVRANRAYQLTIDYNVPCYNGGSVNNTITISNTGVVPPCTNLQINFYTTNCSCSNSPTSYCSATNTGLVDMLGTPDNPPGITTYAEGYDTENLASPGTFQLVATFPVGDSPISVTKYADESLGSNTTYEYFSSPKLTVSEACDGLINLSNDFVICTNDPGIVQGTVYLTGPVNPNYYSGNPALDYLQFAQFNPPNPLPFDPPTGTQLDLTLTNVSYIEATGGQSPLSVPGGDGQADVEFNNSAIYFSPGPSTAAFSGQYSLKLGGLLSQPSVWNANDLHLVFGSPVDLTYDIIETNPPYINITNSCGVTVVNNLSNCFGLCTVPVVNEFFGQPGAPNYTSVSLIVSGGGNGFTVPQFTVNYQGTTPNNAIFQLFLPAGDYAVSALALSTTTITIGTEVITSTTTNIPLSTNITVGCDTVVTNPGTCVPPPTNMVLWLPFDETSGTLTPNLASPGDPGTEVSGPTPVPGAYVDNSLQFNGTDQYVSVPDYSGIDIGSNDLTIDAWVLLSTQAAGFGPFVILDKRASEFGAGYSLSVYDGALILTLSGNNYSDTNRTVQADGKWHFVAAVLDQTIPSLQFFVDGTPTAMVTPTGTPLNLANTNALWVAESPWGGNQPWMGDLDEVEVYDRALATSELGNIYTAGTAGKCKSPCQFEIQCPSNMVVVSASCTNPVQVTYPQPSVIDTCCSNWSASFIPPSGTYFPVGTTTNVTCVVTDNCGNSNSCPFTVQVVCQTGPQIGIGTAGTYASGSSVLFWPQSASNYVLQYTTNLASPNWIPVTNGTAVNALIVTNNLPVEFYRLYYPGP